VRRYASNLGHHCNAAHLRFGHGVVVVPLCGGCAQRPGHEGYLAWLFFSSSTYNLFVVWFGRFFHPPLIPLISATSFSVSFRQYLPFSSSLLFWYVVFVLLVCVASV
jgi:hypothetical protein